MTQTDKQREAFEDWAMLDGFSVIQDGKGNYECRSCQDCWEAWQAATTDFAKRIASILYPGGIKHPQQLEPEWVLKELENRL